MPPRSFSVPVAGIMAAIGIFIVLLPDYDSFVEKMSAAPSLLTAISGLPSDTIVRNGLKFTLLVALLFAVPVVWRSFRFPLFLVAGLLTLAICAYGVGRLLYLGVDLKGAFSRENAAFLIVFLIAGGSALGAEWSTVRKGLIFGVFALAFTKLAFAIYTYRAYGGVQMFSGISTLVADGGILGVWSLAGLWSFAFAWNNIALRRRHLVLVWGVVFIIFAAALAASFRRENMFKLVVTVVSMIVLSGFVHRRAIKATLVSVFAALVGVGVLVVAMVAIFGATDAVERVFSVSSSENRFSGSNEAYLDDWRAWYPIVAKTRGLGVGPGQVYGVDRLVEEAIEADGLIPLHTGTYEMVASFGIVGVFYQLVVLLVVPLVALWRTRGRRTEFDMLFPASAASLLWYGLWPFGPPFYYDIVSIILIGIQLGMVCRPYLLLPVATAVDTMVEGQENFAPSPMNATPRG